MDPNVWILLPMEILEIILLWVPFATLIHFRSISKHCEELLSRKHFVNASEKNHITKTGFLVQLWGHYQSCIVYKFMNCIRHTSLFHVTYPKYSYKIECTIGSFIFLFKYCPLLGHKDYSIVNPFINFFIIIGIIDIGIHGLFSLLREHQSTKERPRYLYVINTMNTVINSLYIAV